ncbi:hypothetical protein DE4576_05488 [Mycobacterium marinum]|nr:hypothetical protein DE4576_05488 [Mycobacterium marinum]
MGCHQRRRTCGVYRDCRSLQPQHISHPARSHTGGSACQRVTLNAGMTAYVALRPDPDEHSGVRTFQGGRVDPRVFQRLPTHLQQHPLLRIHRDCFPRGDPEKLGIKAGHVRHKPAVAGVGLALRVRIRIKQPRHIPTAIQRKPTHHIDAITDHVPQTRGRLDATRQTTRHPHHCHRHIHTDPSRDNRQGRAGHAAEQAQQMLSNRRRGGMVEHQRRGQRQTGVPSQGVTQLERAQRIDTEVLEGQVGIQHRRVRVSQHRGSHISHQPDQRRQLLLRGLLG